MSIKIHHGPNGSYKTSGAIQDDAVPALKDGRLIITNVRGFTLERVLEQMPELPESVDIINLNLESLSDMERMRTWFQWAPRGAFIIFDETQLVFPKSWREKDLDKFEFPGGPEAAAKADRPMNWLDGWTRHRHWNWDIVLTTPNITYIRDDIRSTCEMAYKHSNLAVIGVAGRYKEAQHDAQINRPPADGTIVEYKRIKPATFKLYQSTATGKSQDTKAGKSLFKSPRLLFLLALAAGSIGYLFLSGGTAVLTDGVGSASREAAGGESLPSGPVVAAEIPRAAPAAVRPSPMANESSDGLDFQLNHPFAPRTFAVRAVITANQDGKLRQLGQLDVVEPSGAVLRQSVGELQQLGYHVHVRGSCVVDISHPMGYRGTALCPGRLASAPSASIAGEPAGLASSVVRSVTPDVR